MGRRVLYVAHPLAPTEDEFAHIAVRGAVGDDPVAKQKARALQINIDLALRWLAWLRRSFPQDTFVAPWIAAVLSGEDDGDPKQREAGLVDDCAVVERCDGIVLCGSRISSGMAREVDYGISNRHRHQGTRIESFAVFDLTVLQYKAPPPDVDTLGMTLEEYIREVTP